MVLNMLTAVNLARLQSLYAALQNHHTTNGGSAGGKAAQQGGRGRK